MVSDAVPALDKGDEDGVANLNTTEIASYALRLSVDPRYITSWGYFTDTGFTSMVPVVQEAGDKKAGIPVVFAAVGADEVRTNPNIKQVAFAMSAFRPNVVQFGARKYTNGSPMMPLPGNVANSWGVFKATTNLSLSEDFAKLKTKTRPVGYEQAKILAATTPANTPDYVQVLYGTSTDGTTSTLGPVVFRADFLKNPILPGEQSVMFGFTSDQPPQPEPLQIKDLANAQRAIPAAFARTIQSDVRGVGTGVADGLGVGGGVVPASSGNGAGNAVAPQAAAPAAAGGGGLGGFGGGIGGMPGGGGIGGGGPGIGGGLPGFGGVGGIGGGTGTAGGGGFGGGLGGGTGGGTGTSGGTQAQTGTATTGTTVNFAATLINQQQQQQQQFQWQWQFQTNRNNNINNNHNHNHNHHHGNVVPAPGSFLLALLAIPGLVWVWWRRKPELIAA